MTTYAQLVLGPPGSGKTTYCKGMAEYLRGLGRYVSGSSVGDRALRRRGQGRGGLDSCVAARGGAAEAR